MYKLNRISKLTPDRNISGPMSPILAAQEVAQSLQETCVAVYRVWFDDETMYQINEGTTQRWEVTGHDHLIICFPHWQVFVVDRGVSCSNIAAIFGEADDDVNIKEHNTPWMKQLTAAEIKSLMNDARKEFYAYFRGEFKKQWDEYKQLAANQ